MTTDKKVSHTPAPWAVDTDFHLQNECYHQIIALRGPSYAGPGFAITGCIDIYDAKLIAAAPELLSVLKDAYMTLYGGNSTSIEDAMNRVPANADGFELRIIHAIKKATE